MHQLLTIADAAPHIPDLFESAKKCPFAWESYKPGANRTLGTLFFEPSTRTRWSTETAMLRLGGHVLSMEAAGQSSSEVKGEQLEDTLRVVANYADILAVRTPVANALDCARKYDIKVINCGDGGNEHPTQTLTDLYTIHQSFDLFGPPIHVLVAGDYTFSRTARPLAQTLETYGHKVTVVDGASPPPFLLQEVDVVYMTRRQTERRPALTTQEDFVLTADLAGTMRAGAIIMHPLPRQGELPPEVDANPRARYFQQAANGLCVRMAVLKMMLR